MTKDEKIEQHEAILNKLVQDLEYLKNNLPINQTSKKSGNQNYPTVMQGLSMEDFLKFSQLTATSNAQVATAVSEGIKNGIESISKSKSNFDDFLDRFEDRMLGMLEDEEEDGNGTDKKVNQVMENVLKGLQSLQSMGYDISGLLARMGIKPAPRAVVESSIGEAIENPLDAENQD